MMFETQNRIYVLDDKGDGAFLISGHPKYCPVPTLVTLPNGMPKVGKRLLFQTMQGPRKGKLTITSQVIQVSNVG